MITPPYDILKRINFILIDIANNPIQNIEIIRHILFDARTEINNLRHHIESMSSVRPTSTEMTILQDKSIEMTKMWKHANRHMTDMPTGVEGKDE